MISYPSPRLPAREEEVRQAELVACGVSATRGSLRLRAIVDRLAASLQVRLAAVTIIDRDRQWVAAVHGSDVEEMPRDLSFCAHAILQPGRTMVVCDAASDPRFAEHPLVTSGYKVRFYVGVPLVTRSGAALGALCAVDSEPRCRVTPEEDALLRDLAAEVMAEIDQPQHVRSASRHSIAEIVEQIRRAAEAGDEALVLDLDRVLRQVEHAVETS